MGSGRKIHLLFSGQASFFELKLSGPYVGQKTK